jgi:hypothetical protein
MVLGYLMLALAVSAAAQPPVRTDFSGTWVLDVGRSTPAGEAGGPRGVQGADAAAASGSAHCPIVSSFDRPPTR